MTKPNKHQHGSAQHSQNLKSPSVDADRDRSPPSRIRILAPKAAVSRVISPLSHSHRHLALHLAVGRLTLTAQLAAPQFFSSCSINFSLLAQLRCKNSEGDGEELLVVRATTSVGLLHQPCRHGASSVELGTRSFLLSTSPSQTHRSFLICPFFLVKKFSSCVNVLN